MTIVTKTLRDMRRGLIGWGAGMVALTAAIMAIWPSIRDITDWDLLLEAYPPVMQELFDLQAFSTPEGYLNAELFTLMVPLLLVVFAISRGARLVAGEEEDGLLASVLALPVSRWRVLGGKALALVLSVGVLGAVVGASTLIGSALLGMGLGVGDVVATSVSLALFGAEFGLLAMAVGTATGRRGLAIGVASVAVVAAYLVYAFSRVVEAMEGWEVLSPVQHALLDGPLGVGWHAGYLVAMIGTGAAVAALSGTVLQRRDIAG